MKDKESERERKGDNGESHKGAGAARRRPASRRLCIPRRGLENPTPSSPGEIAAWGDRTNPATLPWWRPPLAPGGRSRIVILCRRGAASIASPPRPSNFLLRRRSFASFRHDQFSARDFSTRTISAWKTSPWISRVRESVLFSLRISYPASLVNLSTHEFCGFIYCEWICWP